jgi:hypothetical protein
MKLVKVENHHKNIFPLVNSSLTANPTDTASEIDKNVGVNKTIEDVPSSSVDSNLPKSVETIAMDNAVEDNVTSSAMDIVT